MALFAFAMRLVRGMYNRHEVGPVPVDGERRSTARCQDEAARVLKPIKETAQWRIR